MPLITVRTLEGLLTPAQKKDMIERVTASARYEVAGKLDRIGSLRDGSNVVVDLKTGDSLDFSFPSIAAQLDCYVDGVNW